MTFYHPSFQRWEIWSWKRLHNLSKITHLVSEGMGVQAQPPLTRKSMPLPLSFLCTHSNEDAPIQTELNYILYNMGDKGPDLL